MLRISNAPTLATSDEEIIPESDEPPDDKVPELNNVFKKENLAQRKASTPGMVRRESLLTKSLQGQVEDSPISPRLPYVPRGMSTTSSHSFASTAELTSDAESLLRSASPSPPFPHKFDLPNKHSKDSAVAIAPLIANDKHDVEETGEAALEKTLGRKRRIMFACQNAAPEPPAQAPPVVKATETAPTEPTVRKPRISFACPAKPVSETKPTPRAEISARSSTSSQSGHATTSGGKADGVQSKQPTAQPVSIAAVPTKSVQHPFHEFASSHDELEDWVHDEPAADRPKLTIHDCLKKEYAIRKLGVEAEEEAEEEEREQQELQDDLDDDDELDPEDDDFAPSDNDETASDDGNETDNEEGFAESDSESDAGSEYQFWVSSTTSTRATSTDNMTHFSARQVSRSRASSTSSAQSCVRSPQSPLMATKSKPSKAIKMRPGTPELPDSTDFVCGTLDEDRPLEAAYISCREQRRRAKLVPIPQDIDPSFPTSDPEAEEDDDDLAGSSDQVWIKDQFEAFHDEVRDQSSNRTMNSPSHTPAPATALTRGVRPHNGARPTLRSPPPRGLARSPAPTRRLFDHAPRKSNHHGQYGRLRSPRGSPTSSKPLPFGITINHLAQRPNADKTSSLPHTPNPFFRNWRNGSQPVSRISSGHVTPGIDSNPDLHVRGPVDIVIGLEKKRQKRKEKYWRQNCRKAAKEQAERRPPPGRGVERMKELGLECAERNRGYGLGQQAQLVLSL